MLLDKTDVDKLHNLHTRKRNKSQYIAMFANAMLSISGKLKCSPDGDAR